MPSVAAVAVRRVAASLVRGISMVTVFFNVLLRRRRRRSGRGGGRIAMATVTAAMVVTVMPIPLAVSVVIAVGFRAAFFPIARTRTGAAAATAATAAASIVMLGRVAGVLALPAFAAAPPLSGAAAMLAFSIALSVSFSLPLALMRAWPMR